MNIGVLTSLYPSSVRPHEGIFAERRWSRMRLRGHDVRIVQPLPHAPLAFLGPLFGKPQWREIARTQSSEVREGIAIQRPRYAHVPSRALSNARAFARAGVAALRAGGDPEVVVLDYAWPAAASVADWCAAGIPVLVNGRGSDVLAVAQTSDLADELGAALRRAGHWCAVSMDLVQAMDRLAGIAGRGVLVSNGVDFVEFQPRDKVAARTRLKLESKSTWVLVVGHLIPRKDPILALEAFARAGISNARLAFVGSGPLQRNLARRARELKLEDHVHFFGPQAPDSLPWWFAACDVLLLTSSREGRPNVVIEALASGRPVVATAAGGTAELLEGFPGAIVDSRDSIAIAKALSAMLQSPPTPERCRAQVSELSWERSLASLEGCLERARAGKVLP